MTEPNPNTPQLATGPYPTGKATPGAPNISIESAKGFVATDNNGTKFHVVSGVATLIQPGGSNPNQLIITLPADFVFPNTNYVIQLTRGILRGTAGDLNAVIASGSQFAINSAAGDDGSDVFWTAIGLGE